MTGSKGVINSSSSEKGEPYSRVRKAKGSRNRGEAFANSAVGEIAEGS